jgi:hypothetical protein
LTTQAQIAAMVENTAFTIGGDFLRAWINQR